MGRPRELSLEERERRLGRGYRPSAVSAPDPASPSHLEDALGPAAKSVMTDERPGIGGFYDGTAFEVGNRP
ncbi:hypothetical protein ASG25_16570 [Rhizobium sp. Leaf384]|uniref:hypothetical protein n=1 Tax=Rhizobium sp. Leaf384 TaxID=1736358 RepID=UPI0007132E09|nr:hypothetical protein [Rhizobium sp. Leaf384]KQS77002.1 hypothetical protein ASG25_16570 [Rhizobium sp. Leaf384]KQS78273.1 hypothetical protein ASG58_07785 [Rhizobium sp. Leaf383]